MTKTCAHIFKAVGEGLWFAGPRVAITSLYGVQEPYIRFVCTYNGLVGFT